MNNSSVAIVILNFNGKNYLEKFLPSVIASTYENKKIIVADNASTDGSVAFLQQHFTTVQIIQLEKNFGFAEGYNRALAQVQAAYYVLLNSDVEVEPSWLEPVIALMQTDSSIAACQPKILSYQHKNFFEYAGACGGYIDAYGYPFARGRIMNICEEDLGQYNSNAEIFWASGAALFIRSDLFHHHGAFDSYFFAHMEEIDLCWRLQRAGYKIVCCPLSKVYHVGGGTLPQGNKRKVYLNFRNNIIMLIKNLPLREKIWKLPLRILLDAVFALKSLLTGNGGNFFAVIKAHFTVIQWCFKSHSSLPSLAKKNIDAYKGVYHSSLLIAFFLRGKKYFSQLDKKKLQ